MAIRLCSQCERLAPRSGIGRRSTWCEVCFTEWEIKRSDPREQTKLYERFDAKVTEDFPCWIWTGARGSTGYGNVSVAGRTCYAHRIAYERYKGPISPALDIDHICGKRLCVNPDHLEAVPRTSNLRRSRALRRTQLGIAPSTQYGLMQRE